MTRHLPPLSMVSVVVVTYNSPELLRECLGAVDSRAPVIVVDDASPAGEAEMVRREFPGVQLIAQPRNRGFGTAVNAGVAAATTPWVLVLNPDARPMADAVERLVEFASSRPRLGALGPVLPRCDDRPQRSTLRAPASPLALASWAALPGVASTGYEWLRKVRRTPRQERLRRGEFLQCSALLLRREAFVQVGGFDQAFFMYGEDADLCERLLAAGWNVDLCPTARFVHGGAGSTSADPDQMFRELLRSWLRLIAKRDGMARAERARRWLVPALRLRALWSREASPANAGDWLASATIDELLGIPR
jgi:N-acetylglucosaminyl-diphospho-decaprenol L-rhamnosyltransferase